MDVDAATGPWVMEPPAILETLPSGGRHFTPPRDPTLVMDPTSQGFSFNTELECPGREQ